MRMKRTLVTVKSLLCAFVFQESMEVLQLARGIFYSYPKDVGLASWWKRTTAVNLDLENLNSISCSLQCLRKQFDLSDLGVAKEFQREMEILFAGPAGTNVRKFSAQMIDVLADFVTNVLWEFDCDEQSPGFDIFRHEFRSIPIRSR